jgi:hypothetical protein
VDGYECTAEVLQGSKEKDGNTGEVKRNHGHLHFCEKTHERVRTPKTTKTANSPRYRKWARPPQKTTALRHHRCITT